MQIDPSIKNVLWIRVGALGDLLIATAALSETLLRFPNANVSILGPRVWIDLIDPQLFPRVDRIFSPCDGGGFQVWRPRVEEGNWFSGEVIPDAEVWKQFQAVVNHRIESHRYSIPIWRARVPVRIGSGPWWTRFLLTHWSPDLGKDPVIHERDWHLRVATTPPATELLTGFSILENRKVLNAEQRYGLDPSVWERWKSVGLPQLRTVDEKFCEKVWGLRRKKFFLVNPTSSRREKAWPSSRFREFLVQEKEKFFSLGLELIVVGAPGETLWLKEVAGEDFQVVQPKSVRELFHLVEGARGLLTNASSMHFIAASTQTPAVVLLGRSDAAIWGPLGSDKILVQKRPKSYGSKNIFVQESEAYHSIPIDTVVTAVQRLLDL